jgi:hypothetical protein
MSNFLKCLGFQIVLFPVRTRFLTLLCDVNEEKSKDTFKKWMDEKVEYGIEKILEV